MASERQEQMSAPEGFLDRTALKLHGTTDASVWAHEFCERFVVLKRNDENPAVLEDADDKGLMSAWFANAIETGRMAGYKQGQSDPRPSGGCIVTEL